MTNVEQILRESRELALATDGDTTTRGEQLAEETCHRPVTGPLRVRVNPPTDKWVARMTSLFESQYSDDDLA